MQVFLVIVCILAAAAYLGWQFYQRFFKASGKCDGCAMSKMDKK
jgi:predicted negative regulator of RcsB-dependent stress response